MTGGLLTFQPGGQLTIDVGTGDGHAELRVTDIGIGIPPAFLPYVFDKFRQADASFTRQHGGLGLGLAIARHLIELHGASIDVRSAGEGARRDPRRKAPAATSRRLIA